MDLGVGLPTSGPHPSTESITRIAQGAEELGYGALWTYERLLYPVDTPQPLSAAYVNVWEPIETLAYAAAATTTIKLGTSIIVAPFHLPVVVARRFATLDQLSGGRAIAGIGQGWMDQEYLTANVTRAGLGRRTREFLAAMRAAWGPDPVSFEGRFYRIPPSKINPKPVHTGGIPILVGAFAPAAIRRAAQIADGFNPIAGSRESLVEAVNLFRSAARDAGRDPGALKVVVRANVPLTAEPVGDEDRPFLGGSAEQIAGDLESLRDLSIDHVLFSNQAPADSVDDELRLLEGLQKAASRA